MTLCEKIAGQIKEHFAAGGSIQVTTYAKSCVYGPGHKDSFVLTNAGELVRKTKRGSECLGHGDHLYVGIRFSK